MASSESQGKTIALVVFVLLWFGSSVTAYVFWQKWDAASQEADKGNKAAAAASAEVQKSKSQYEALREKLIFSAQPLAHEAVIENITNDLKPDLPPSPPANVAKVMESVTAYANYQAALKETHNLIKQLSDHIAKLDKDKKELEEQLKAARAQYAAENKKYQDAAAAADRDKKQQVAEFEGIIAEKSTEIESSQRRLNAAIAQLEQFTRDSDRTTGRLRQENQELRDNLDNVKTMQERQKEIKFERAKGRVIELTDGGRSAVVDIGHADGVRTGLTFGIYGRDRGGNPNELPKAAGEVVRVIDDHRSVARISLEQLNDPVLPEDLLYNPVWTPGEKAGIAFVGLIRMGQSDEDQSDAFRRLIEENGGKIDSYMDLQTGRVNGSINVKTQWLVIGDIPEPNPKVSDKFDKSASELYSRLVRASSDMREAAKRNGVRVINLRNFLNFWGYNTPDRTIPAGKEYDLLFRRTARSETEQTPGN